MYTISHKKVIAQGPFHSLTTYVYLHDCALVRIFVCFGIPCVLSPFWWWGIECLNDPNSYAGWSFYTPVRAIQARQVEG